MVITSFSAKQIRLSAGLFYFSRRPKF